MSLGQNNIRNEAIIVCIRLRPLLIHEDLEFWYADEEKNQIATINNLSNKIENKETNFNNTKEKDLKRMLLDHIYSPQLLTFDKVYSQKSSSQLIYKEMGKPIIKSVLSGYNGTIFMYGQTTSGKTFTMLGNPEKPGILPCALRDIFNQIEKDTENEYNVYCSYIEIYNENLIDLLNSHSPNLKLIDDPKYGVIVADAKKIKIMNFDDGIILLNFGEENRKYRETQINEYSSRSHTIFQIFIESDSLNMRSIHSIRYSCLNLVDLAGSERLNDYDSRTEAQGETGYINKSLFVLANVINKLADSKIGYIPYRDSKITRLLSQALGGNSLTTIICTASPATENYNQTLSTLRFAIRAKTVKNKATVNEYQDEKISIEEYRKEIKKLREELNYKEVEKEKEILQQIMKTNESLTNELENFKGKYLIEKERNEQMSNEMENIKMSLNTLNANKQFTTSQNSNYTNLNQSNNNNSNFISSKENFFLMNSGNLNKNNITDNMMNSINDDMKFANFIESNYNSQYEPSNLNITKQKQYINEIKNNSNNMHIPTNKSNSSTQNTIGITEQFIDNVVNIINRNYLLEGIKNNQWQEESQKIESDFKNEINLLQSRYLEILRDCSYKYFPNKNIDNLIFKNYLRNTKEGNSKEEAKNENDEAEEIIQKIKNKSIFYEAKLNFVPSKNESFENAIKRLRSLYEEKTNKLEKIMDEYKNLLENHYRKKIQNAKNFQLNSMDNPNSNLSIMNITTEHNEKLKQLREIYQEKLKNFEQNFFENLKMITTNFGNSK